MVTLTMYLDITKRKVLKGKFFRKAKAKERPMIARKFGRRYVRAIEMVLGDVIEPHIQDYDNPSLSWNSHDYDNSIHYMCIGCCCRKHNMFYYMSVQTKAIHLFGAYSMFPVTDAPKKN